MGCVNSTSGNGQETLSVPTEEERVAGPATMPSGDYLEFIAPGALNTIGNQFDIIQHKINHESISLNVSELVGALDEYMGMLRQKLALVQQTEDAKERLNYKKKKKLALPT